VGEKSSTGDAVTTMLTCEANDELVGGTGVVDASSSGVRTATLALPLSTSLLNDTSLCLLRVLPLLLPLFPPVDTTATSQDELAILWAPCESSLELFLWPWLVVAAVLDWRVCLWLLSSTALPGVFCACVCDAELGDWLSEDETGVAEPGCDDC